MTGREDIALSPTIFTGLKNSNNLEGDKRTSFIIVFPMILRYSGKGGEQNGENASIWVYILHSSASSSLI